MDKQIRGLTLIELVIAITLMSLLVLSYYSIYFFSSYHTISAINRTRIQNEVTIALEHMTKEISYGIGDFNQPVVEIVNIAGDRAIKVWIDGNPYSSPVVAPDGRRDSYPDDHQIAYRFTGAGGAAANSYQIWYYANCVGPNCNQPGNIGPEVVARHISSFTRNIMDNYLNIVIVARWKPNQDASVDNPEVTMRTQIKMPSVSTN
jgi:prepilin-type N-terminal cleavage/methylation domain-containing protein